MTNLEVVEQVVGLYSFLLERRDRIEYISVSHQIELHSEALATDVDILDSLDLQNDELRENKLRIHLNVSDISRNALQIFWSDADFYLRSLNEEVWQGAILILRACLKISWS